MAKIPPTPKNHHTPHPGESPIGERDFDDLTDDEQRATLNHELQMWSHMKMNPQAVPHNIFNMDCQLLALVQFVVKELGVDEDKLNRYYRRVAYDKLTTLRAQSNQSRIIIPDIGI